MSLRPYHELAQEAGVSGNNVAHTAFGKTIALLATSATHKSLQRILIFTTFGWMIFLFFFILPNISGESDFIIFPLFCLGPLVIIGVVMVGYTVLLGSLFDIPSVSISAVKLRRGDEIDVHYQQKIKRSTTFKATTFSLILRESATYDSGSSTVTEHHDHVVDQIADFDVQVSSNTGVDQKLAFKIPHDAMHSFEATRNTLHWYLKIHFDVARFPDFEKTYQLKVLSEAMNES